MTSPVQITPVCVCRSVDCTVPLGYCHCGCGQLAPVCTRNRGKNRIAIGLPQIYIRGHAMRNRKLSQESLARLVRAQARVLSNPDTLNRRIAQVKVVGFRPLLVVRKPHKQKRTKTYYAFRKRMWERDGNACTRCGSTNRLHLHHFVPRTLRPDLRFDSNNVTTLCHSCHMREEANVKHALRRGGGTL